nr:uncharacterized protein CTRU02_11725 [Colletotrichum truncatum]KAF6785425.1 hypothetical protein CTRU02_11725 [Colletotrichum truncatum]
MASSFPANKQTVVGLLMFLLVLWTLSTFTQTTPNTPARITHQQSGDAIAPLRNPDSQSDSKSNSKTGKPSPDKSKSPPGASHPDKAPQVSLPPWYKEDDEKADAKASNQPEKATPSAVDGAAGSSNKPGSSSSDSSKPASSPAKGKTLILYAFAESAPALDNLQFFIKQGLHDAADFVFLLNGETNASSIIPEKKNIRVVKRDNTCFDLGAYGEVLRENDLYKKYKRFIMMNASIRGPFLPHWAKSCWSDLYLDRVTDKIKLVGMTGNCWPRFHVQSMIWATDDIGIDLLLHPPPNSSDPDQFGNENDAVGLAGCYDGWNHAVHAEVGATGLFTKQGYEVDLMMTAFHSSKKYIEECDTSHNGDVLWNGAYFGTNVHPYETIFIKANRNIDPVLIDHLTTWQQASGYSSYDVCGTSS